MDSAKPMYFSTEVQPARTAAECLAMLAAHGAETVAISHDKATRQPSGLSFTIGTPWGARQYDLPVKVTATQKRLGLAYAEGKIPARFTGTEQARRVAWRVLKAWIAAQVEFIELGQAELPEIMLPWMKVDADRTVWSAYQADEQRALEAGR